MEDTKNGSSRLRWPSRHRGPKNPRRESGTGPGINRHNPQWKPRVTATERIESEILNLENRLQEIEEQVELASESQDLAAIARLGAEHTQIQSQLEQRWTEWGQ